MANNTYMVGCLLILNRIITNILSTQITITHKNTNIYMENPFSLKGKIMGQTPNQFHNYQINYNISCICLTTKEKYLLFFYGSNTLSLRLTVKEKHLLSHTLVICLEGGNTPPSSLAFFYSFFSFPSNSRWLSSWRWQHFVISSIAFFSSSLSFHVALLGYLLEGDNHFLYPL